MMMNWNRLSSLAVAVAYLIIAYEHGGSETAWRIVLFLIFPLFCIWFGNEMGDFVGPVWGGSITAPTPRILVCILGWLLLLLPILIGVVTVAYKLAARTYS